MTKQTRLKRCINWVSRNYFLEIMPHPIASNSSLYLCISLA